MIDPEPTIDSAIDEAARVLAETHGVDYYHASGQHQAYWRREAQTVVGAWQEDRRRCAEENVPSPTPTAPSLRSELAEAQAEIARLTGFLERARSGWYECLSILSRATDQLAERSAIVEAATALVKYRRDPGPNPTRLELERRIAAVDDAVAAVAEGQKL